MQRHETLRSFYILKGQSDYIYAQIYTINFPLLLYFRTVKVWAAALFRVSLLIRPIFFANYYTVISAKQNERALKRFSFEL
jgi:hypothetical protein